MPSFGEVRRIPLVQIIAACRELGRSAGEDYSPPLTFVVAQKRHNTRFFPKGNDADRSGNVLPGQALLATCLQIKIAESDSRLVPCLSWQGVV